MLTGIVSRFLEEDTITRSKEEKKSGNDRRWVGNCSERGRFGERGGNGGGCSDASASDVTKDKSPNELVMMSDGALYGNLLVAVLG